MFVFENRGRYAYAETEHDGVRVIVRQRAQSIEFFLPSSIPEGQFNVHIVDKDVVYIVFCIAVISRVRRTRQEEEIGYQRQWVHWRQAVMLVQARIDYFVSRLTKQ